ncbi:MAG: hypothetical protein V1918_10110 [Planctomycetota bacterium]
MTNLFVGTGNTLQQLQVVSLDEESLRDIKLRITLQPHFLGEPLVVIGEAADFPQVGASDPYTLIGLDARGRSVVLELRLGVARSEQPFQALRYAAYLAKLSAEDLGKIAHAFAARPANLALQRAWREANVEMSDEAVELASLLATTFSRDAEDFTATVNGAQRILVAAEAFDSRMVEMIDWLARGGADVRGLQYRKFMIGGQEIYYAEQVVPKTDPAIDAVANRISVAAEGEDPWRVRGLAYYLERVIPAVGNRMEELLHLIHPHLFAIDWSNKYYFLIRGARRNLRIRVYQRNRLDIGFLNATVEGVSEYLRPYGITEVEVTTIGGYDKSPFLCTNSDTVFDERWHCLFCDWLRGAEPGASKPEIPTAKRRHA